MVPRDFLGMPTQLTSIRLRGAPLKFATPSGGWSRAWRSAICARHGFARSPLGPLSAIKLRRRIPLIDVGTIAAVKRGDIAVKPAVERFTETGAVFADGSSGDFDAAVLATGYRPALEEMVAVPDVLAPDGFPRDWRGGGACPNLFFVGFDQPATGLLRQIAIEAQTVAAAIAAADAQGALGAPRRQSVRCGAHLLEQADHHDEQPRYTAHGFLISGSSSDLGMSSRFS